MKTTLIILMIVLALVELWMWFRLMGRELRVEQRKVALKLLDLFGHARPGLRLVVVVEKLRVGGPQASALRLLRVLVRAKPGKGFLEPGAVGRRSVHRASERIQHALL